MRRIYITLLPLFCSIAAAMPVHSPVPGGIIVLPLEKNATSAELLGKRGSFFKEADRIYALLPIPLGAPAGPHKVYQFQNAKAAKNLSLDIEKKSYAIQRLTIKKRRKVEPNREDLKRIKKESSRKQKAKSFRRAGFANVDFIWPVEGELSSPFGLRRVLNGKPRAPHRGIDIAACAGVPVAAAADGVVVDAGNFFFSGNLVFIEHKEGVVTTYAHLDKIAVRPGERVKKGDLVGYVGSTGRVTGPHLHFGVMVDSVYVDPILFLPTRHPSSSAAEKLSKISHGPAGRNPHHK